MPIAFLRSLFSKLPTYHREVFEQTSQAPHDFIAEDPDQCSALSFPEPLGGPLRHGH